GYRYPGPEICSRPYRLLTAVGMSDVALDAEIEASERELAAGPRSAAPFARAVWQLVLCVFGRFEQAAEQGARLGDRVFQSIRLVHVADLAFYRGLATAAQSPIGMRPHRRQRRILRGSLTQLRRWARSGPDFQHMANLLEAEHARLAGTSGAPERFTTVRCSAR